MRGREEGALTACFPHEAISHLRRQDTDPAGQAIKNMVRPGPFLRVGAF